MPPPSSQVQKTTVLTFMSVIAGSAIYIIGRRLWNKAKWQDYVHKLKTIEKEVARKTSLGYSLEKRLPTQVELLKLSEECFVLTESLHGKGKGNYAAFYSFFYKICEISQTTFYNYAALSLQKSKDEFITLLDIDVKNALQKNYMDKVRKPFIDQGGLWAGGRSPIDNTTLATIMPNHEVKAMLTASGLQRFMLTYIQKKQKAILKKVSELLGFDLTKVSADLVKITLSDTSIPFSSQKINSQHISFQLLLKYGTPLEDWGQVPQEIKEKLWKMVKERFKEPTVTNPVFDAFSKFAKDKPGDFVTAEDLKISTENNLQPRQLRWLAPMAGLWSNQLGGLSRTCIENHTPIRYFLMQWIRTSALEDLNDKGQRVTIRAASCHESSRVRANQGLYQREHGMSMSSSGLPEGLKQHNTLLYRLGIPVESGAPLSNLYCDIEKILREIYFLNPKTSNSSLLQGETYFTVGQNCISGSSVPQTQHTQISAGILTDFPIYHMLPAHCKFELSIDTVVELVPVGKKEDAFYLRITTNNPIAKNFIQCLIDLRMSLLEKFGGSKKIDFHFHAIPDGKGNFVIIFAPIARLEKREINKSTVYVNPDSGETHAKLGLPVEHIHLGNGAGTFGISFSDKQTVEKVVKEGKALLCKLWDFTALKGSKEHAADFFQKKVSAKPRFFS